MFILSCCLKLWHGPLGESLSDTIESLSNDDGDVNENGKKAISWDRQNNNFARASHVHHSLVLCRLLCRHCTTTTWNFLISRFMEDVNTSQRFSSCFCELRYSPLEFNSWNIANIWQIKVHSWNKPSAMKFEIVRICFSGDVLAAFAFVVALAP